mmetsp:Transcript_19820/g.36620  ORF Transcript_19820/g.36620 Transcript_19820/m.36620 type:complete len:82 (+) Transcript_19820:1596-1841(+)
MIQFEEELNASRAAFRAIEAQAEDLKDQQSKEISILEKQVEYIEEQLERLRAENRSYAAREQELLKFPRSMEVYTKSTKKS